MVDTAPEFESRDSLGSTAHFNATVTTTAINIPAAAGSKIAEIFLYNPSGNLKTSILNISFDGGTNYTEIPWNSSLIWSPKGGLTQVKVKSSAGTISYQVIINFEVN